MFTRTPPQKTSYLWALRKDDLITELEKWDVPYDESASLIELRHTLRDFLVQKKLTNNNRINSCDNILKDLDNSEFVDEGATAGIINDETEEIESKLRLELEKQKEEWFKHREEKENQLRKEISDKLHREWAYRQREIEESDNKARENFAKQLQIELEKKAQSLVTQTTDLQTRKWNKVADALSRNEEINSNTDIEETVDSSILINNVKIDDCLLKMTKPRDELLYEITKLHEVLSQFGEVENPHQYGISSLACAHKPPEIRKMRLEFERKMKIKRLFGSASPGPYTKYSPQRTNFKKSTNIKTPVEPYDPTRPGFQRPSSSSVPSKPQTKSSINSLPVSLPLDQIQIPILQKIIPKPVIVSNPAPNQTTKPDNNSPTPRLASNPPSEPINEASSSPTREIEPSWLSYDTAEILENYSPDNIFPGTPQFEPPRKIETAMDRIKKAFRPLAELDNRPLQEGRRRRTFHAYDKFEQVFKVIQTRNVTIKKPTGKYLKDFLPKFTEPTSSSSGSI
ncbi:hypothetical protein KQX54_014214 [Cotesia glomerata]|uniref:Uncharacterized protein n=1 Tax=Cotesia glomerata TaxID=32391 RepID=A0AAV7J4J3_COTGL|nr:hypothetical protein KQX54_014214 [Cotesia glomerata]